MLNFIKQTQINENSKHERKDKLESWLISREKTRMPNEICEHSMKSNGNGYSDVILKIKKTFEFVNEWDIKHAFGNDFFLKLSE